MLRLILILAAAAGLQAATLERLSLDDMVSKSSDIVRARVVSSRSAVRGGVIYTWYHLQVSERWKGGAQQLDVAVPGGTTNGLRQTIAGAPTLKPGDEYVFFIWTSRTGLAQIIGLVQGLFGIAQDPTGKMTAARAASSEPMLDPVTHRPVADSPVQYGYQELKALVAAKLSGRANQ